MGPQISWRQDWWFTINKCGCTLKSLLWILPSPWMVIDDWQSTPTLKCLLWMLPPQDWWFIIDNVHAPWNVDCKSPPQDWQFVIDNACTLKCFLWCLPGFMNHDWQCTCILKCLLWIPPPDVIDNSWLIVCMHVPWNVYCEFPPTTGLTMYDWQYTHTLKCLLWNLPPWG